MRPMKAASEEADAVLAAVTFPKLASPKLDGVRGFNEDGVMLSNSLKRLKNSNLQLEFGISQYFGYDGEFVAGSPTGASVCRDTMSVVNSLDKPIDDVKFYVFDFRYCKPTVPFEDRISQLQGDCKVIVLEHRLITCRDDLLNYDGEKIDEGYEGLILRDPLGPYKFGRSTLREQYALKLKRFADDEAVVIGFVEKMHNANEKTLEKNGKAARSSHKAGMVPMGTLGGMLVRWRDKEFTIGCGQLTHEEAQYIWDRQDQFLGRTLTFKYFPYGMKDLPRHPIFKCWSPDGI